MKLTSTEQNRTNREIKLRKPVRRYMHKSNVGKKMYRNAKKSLRITLTSKNRLRADDAHRNNM